MEKAKMKKFKIKLTNPDGLVTGVRVVSLTVSAETRQKAQNYAVAWARRNFGPQYRLHDSEADKT